MQCRPMTQKKCNGEKLFTKHITVSQNFVGPPSVDAGPAVNKHWLYDSCLLGIMLEEMLVWLFFILLTWASDDPRSSVYVYKAR